MQQQLSVITLGIADLARSKRFYIDGFGWTPVFENEEIAFYQMNGFILGTWLQGALEQDMQRIGLARPGAFALAHNVASADAVTPLIDRLAAAGESCCASAMRRPIEAFAAMSPIPMIMPGKSRGIPPGRSTSGGW